MGIKRSPNALGRLGAIKTDKEPGVQQCQTLHPTGPLDHPLLVVCGPRKGPMATSYGLGSKQPICQPTTLTLKELAKFGTPHVYPMENSESNRYNLCDMTVIFENHEIYSLFRIYIRSVTKI